MCSALDTSTEKDIQKALQNLQKGRSSLSIAHRLSVSASSNATIYFGAQPSLSCESDYCFSGCVSPWHYNYQHSNTNHLSSILVLKDGQIVEQGSHKELLAQDGVFASMWADQISASEEPAVSIGDRSVKEAVPGYLEDEPEPAPVAEADVAAENGAPSVSQDRAVSGVFVDAPEVIPAALESTEEATDAPPVPVKESGSDEPTAPPLAFPATDDTTSQRAPSERIPSQTVGGVTFGDSVNAPPSRSGTPDPEAEPKRKRISSQNLQRFARKMSLATRRTGSATLIPGLKREGSSTPLASQDGEGESSARNSNDSPNDSVQTDVDQSKNKKKDKEKRKSLF